MVGADFSLHALWAAPSGFVLAPRAKFHQVHNVAPPAAFFARHVRAQARELHVLEMHRTVQEELAAFLARLGNRLPSHERLVIKGSASEVLLNLAGRLSADLLVAGTHGRTGVARALLGSVAESCCSEPPATSWSPRRGRLGARPASCSGGR